LNRVLIVTKIVGVELGHGNSRHTAFSRPNPTEQLQITS